MRNLMRLLILGLLLTFAGNAFATDTSKKPCSRDEAIQAEKDTDRLTDWDRMYESYRHFSHCDDAAIGEGYSDAVGKLLANKWQEFGELAKLASRDTGFQCFVLKHVDETIPADTLGKIVENAKTHCPSGQGRFCRFIVAAASP
jgi:hypothetical protein